MPFVGVQVPFIAPSVLRSSRRPARFGPCFLLISFSNVLFLEIADMQGQSRVSLRDSEDNHTDCCETALLLEFLGQSSKGEKLHYSVGRKLESPFFVNHL